MYYQTNNAVDTTANGDIKAEDAVGHTANQIMNLLFSPEFGLTPPQQNQALIEVRNQINAEWRRLINISEQEREERVKTEGMLRSIIDQQVLLKESNSY